MRNELQSLINQSREEEIPQFKGTREQLEDLTSPSIKRYNNMNLSKIIEEEQKKFDEKFYEGERNSVYCHKHNIFATPHEVKSHLSASLIRVALITKPTCSHEFRYSHIEYPPMGTYIDIPPNKEVVICFKCGKLLKTIII